MSYEGRWVMARLKIDYHRCFLQSVREEGLGGERSCMGPERGLVAEEKAGPKFQTRPMFRG